MVQIALWKYYFSSGIDWKDETI